MADVNAQSLAPIYRGEDAVIDFAPPTPTNISGWALVFSLSALPGSPVLLTRGIGSGVTITDAINGLFRVTLTAAQTAAQVPDLRAWDVWRTDTGAAERIAGGTVNVSEPVRTPV